SGMKGKKKVSDLLTDMKLSPTDKERVLVIENDEEIACVVGMRVAEKYKLREDTIKILKISRVRKEV
ncbi:MAG: tRNA(Ile)-lysidine synthetase, partial [Flavobacteriaceae bacterium]|nr:tRNA(Ile)-lysidine synthetase [Flavobacteriaceae bacterium]